MFVLPSSLWKKTSPLAEEVDISPPVQIILDRMESGDISVQLTHTAPVSCWRWSYILQDEGVGEEYEIKEATPPGTRAAIKWCSPSHPFFTQGEAKALSEVAINILLQKSREEEERLVAKGIEDRAALVEKYDVLRGHSSQKGV